MLYATTATALMCLAAVQEVSSFEYHLRGVDRTNGTQTGSLHHQRELQSSDGMWQLCAEEGGTCDFSGSKIVRYGANDNFFYGNFQNGGVSCSNAVFGDPLHRTIKHCYTFENSGPSQGVAGNSHSCEGNPGETCRYSYGMFDHEVPCDPAFFGHSILTGSCEFSTGSWQHCADEGGTCNIPSGVKTTVRYGAAGHFIWRDEEGAVPCTNGRFGDPIRGTVKTCLIFTGQWNSCGGQICNLPNHSYTVRFGGVTSSNTQGKTGELIQLPHVPVAAANLPDGRILTWSAATKYKNPMGPGQTYTCIFDPDTSACPIHLVTNTNHDMFCPGTAVLPDSRVMITGGTHATPTTFYDPSNDSWYSGPDLNVGRGYHSMMMKRDGSVFTMGGSWYSLGTTPGNKYGELWDPRSPNVWQLKSGINTIPSIVTADPEPLFPDNHMWLFEAPNGRIFQAGPSEQMHWIDVAGNGSITPSIVRGDHGDAMCGTVTMYDVGKLLVAGGAPTYRTNAPAKRNAYVVDITGSEATVKRVGDMSFLRTYGNSVVLPNGEVVIIGGQVRSELFGNTGAVLDIEIWNPGSATFRIGGRLNVPRVYHSMAILMKDGRVLAGGGGLCGTTGYCVARNLNHDDVEIYTPPYLLESSGSLRSDRPVIASAPSSLQSGQTFQVTLNASGDDDGTTFALVRLSAVTHSTNNDMRRIPCPVVSNNNNNGVFTLKVPNVGTLPGMYWLFALNGRGTPSEGAAVALDA